MFEANNTVKVMPREDLQRLCVSIALIFWSLLLPSVLINVFAFSLPFLGSSSSPLYYARLIFVLHGVLLVAAMWMVISTVRKVDKNFKLLGLCLLFMVSLEFTLWISLQFMQPLVMEDRLNSSFFYMVNLSRHIVGFVSVLIGIRFFRRWLIYLGSASLAKKYGYYFWIYFAILLGLDVVNFLVEYSRFGLVYYSLTLLEIAVYCWGFVLLYRFRHYIHCILKSLCIECGYLLYGLPNPRCPECGTDVLVVVSDA